MDETIESTPGEAQTANPPANASRKRSRKQINANVVESWATRHLERYASSAANLRRVLLRRVGRIERKQDERFPDAPAWVEAAVGRMIERGYLDDFRYARAIVERMRTRGASTRRIEHYLAQQGVPGEIGRAVVRQGEEPDAERKAALRYARRRHLGPYRRDPDPETEYRQRDLAALGRAGFAYDIARQVIDATALEDLDEASNPTG